MRSFRFVIPIKLDDLTQTDGQFDVYSVRLEYNIREIPTKLNDCSDNLRSNGIHFILEDFDVFYYCLKNFDTLDAKHKENAWKLIYKSLNQLYSDLENFINNFDPNERNNYCNLLKMIVYVFCSLSELFEEQDIKQSSNIDFDNINKKTNKKNKRTEQSYDWQQNKDRGMAVMLRILALPLHRLFSPPVVEDEFINVIMKCCYKMVENPIISRQKDSNFTTNLFHLIGTGIEKHRQSLSFCLKLIQLLQHKEQLVPILANLVETVVKKHNQKLLISEIIREIKRIDIRELSRDSSGPKAISTFLVELSEKCPQEILPSISDLLDFLTEDSYLMRNATLCIIGNLVIKELSKEGSKERHLRDQLLDKLEDHIHDNTSYTRSRALHVWCNLSQAEVIPLPRLETLIDVVIGRLRDKSCYVRRYAVQFLTQFLIRNPFAAKLSLEVLKTNHQTQEERLKELIEFDQQKVKSTEDNEQKNLIMFWNSIETQFIEYWTELETTSVTASDDDSDEIQNQTILSECIDVEEVFIRFRSLIFEKNFKSVLSLLKNIKDQFPDNQLINQNGDESMDEEEDQEDEHQEEKENPTDSDGDQNAIEDRVSRPPLPEPIALAKRIFLANDSNKEKTPFDLGSKDVEKGIERLVTDIIQSSQGTASQSESRPTTTTIEPIRPSLNGDSDESMVNEISKQQIIVKYLSDCIRFTEQIQLAIPLVSELLFSRNISDVQEAIEFFVSAFKFGVQGSICGVRKLIVLIWSQEKTIKDAAISAYKSIYLNFESEDFDSSDKTMRQKAFSVIKSLSDLVMGATLGELISIERLLKELMDSKDIQAIHIQILWERFAMKLSNTTPEDSRAAIQLIGMMATSDPELIRTEKTLNAIIDTALGERGRHDSRLVAETCIALGKAYQLPKTEKCEMFFRLPKNHVLFERLTTLLIDGLENNDDIYYNMMSDTVIKVIFRLAENPDYICEQMIKQMLQKMLALTQNEDLTNEMQTTQQNKENISENNERTVETDVQSIASSQPSNLTESVFPLTVQRVRLLNSELLSRFISMLGDIALNALIHIDLNILTELKIRNYIKEEKDKKNKTPRRKSRTPGKTPGTVAGDQNLEEEIGLAGANAVEDQEQEFLQNICNTDIVLGNNLLAQLSDLVVGIAQDQITFTDVKLQTAATLALAKYMSISENFCKTNLRLLFTIMERSQQPIIRANGIIAVGDLCVRFPNDLDLWSVHMFQYLRDPDVEVKMNTLKVLSRLILSDMLKVKGQISEIAVLMVHSNEVLSASARLFFTELGKKQNAIYNVLPDIISHLSDTEKGLKGEEDFQTVMRFIFDLIDKGRQITCLVEKLCQRFRMTTNERQWRDMAFCLSLLSYSERSFQKLHENLICFADKLFEDSVHEFIQTIITNARKMANIKTETKQLIDEFEQKVKECRTKGVNEDDSEFQKVIGTPQSNKKAGRQPSTKKKSTVSSSASKNRPNKQIKAKRKIVSKGSDEDDTDEDVSSNKRVANQSSNRRPERPQRQAKRLQPIISSDEESS